jgi:hypothetical protein
MNIEITDWKPYNKNTLRGFFTIQIMDYGFEIHDCMLHEKGTRKWISFPSKPWTNATGDVVKDDNGKIKYSPPIIKFLNDDDYYAAQNTILKMLGDLIGNSDSGISHIPMDIPNF